MRGRSGCWSNVAQDAEHNRTAGVVEGCAMHVDQSRFFLISDAEMGCELASPGLTYRTRLRNLRITVDQ
jgi:hypothetical protein